MCKLSYLTALISLVLTSAILICEQRSHASDIPTAQVKRAQDSTLLIYEDAQGRRLPHGTGFFVNADGLIATADHVIFDEKKDQIHTSLFAQRVSGDNLISYSVSVSSRMRMDRSGCDIAFLKINGPFETNSFPFLELATSYETGQEVFICGYPKVFDTAKPFPLFRQGLISSDLYNVERVPIILLDLKAVSGFSGAPVIQKSTGSVIGVLKGDFKTNTEAGFSFAYPLAPKMFH